MEEEEEEEEEERGRERESKIENDELGQISLLS